MFLKKGEKQNGKLKQTNQSDLYCCSMAFN